MQQDEVYSHSQTQITMRPVQMLGQTPVRLIRGHFFGRGLSMTNHRYVINNDSGLKVWYNLMAINICEFLRL